MAKTDILAFVAQVPCGPAREVVDMVPLMMNYQDMFISGASWAQVKRKVPSVSFGRFWWAKVRKYDMRNQATMVFWRNADLSDRQIERYFCDKPSSSLVVDDDIDDEDAIDYVLGRGRAFVGRDGLLTVPKEEPVELDERDWTYLYRARVLEGDLPLVPWRPLELVPLGVAWCGEAFLGRSSELISEVSKDLLSEVVGAMLEEIAVDVGFDEDVTNIWEFRAR